MSNGFPSSSIMGDSTRVTKPITWQKKHVNGDPFWLDEDAMLARLPTPVVITWPVVHNTGWGVFSRNLLREMMRKDEFTPLLTVPFEKTPEMAAVFSSSEQHQLVRWQQLLYRWLMKNAVQTLPASSLSAKTEVHNVILHLPVVHGLGNDLSGSMDMPLYIQVSGIPIGFTFIGKPTVGVIFMESTSAVNITRVSVFDYLVAGSEWTKRHLRSVIRAHNQQQPKSAQVRTKVVKALQGIDHEIYAARAVHPPLEVLFKKNFVVFSGGKLEFRKGQDIVVAAFRIFQQQVAPEAVLVTLWHTLYPELFQGLEAHGHVDMHLPVDSSPVELDAWLLRSGLPAHSFRNLPAMAERDLARTLDHVHAAVFTSRAESGTNLFATQTLGMGIPTLVSNNTGHTELVNLGVRLCYAVPQMAEVDWGHSQMQHWGETDVMEVVRQLANVYQEFQESTIADGRATSETIHNLFSWERCYESIAAVVLEGRK